MLNSTELEKDQETEVLSLAFTSKKFSVADICGFCRNLKQSPIFLDTVRPKLVSYFDEKMVTCGLNALERGEVLHMLAEIVLDKISFEAGYSASMFEEAATFNFSKMSAKKGSSWWDVLSELDCEAFSDSEVETIWASLVVLPFIR